MYFPSRQLEAGLYDTIRPYQQKPTFIDPHTPSDIYVFDDDTRVEHHIFKDSERFQKHLSVTMRPRNRVVSISSVNSIRPLRITFNAIRKLMQQYEIGSSFLDLVLSFGSKPHSSNAGHGGMTVTRREDGSCDIQYLFTYAKDQNVNGRIAWTVRQVCLFHRFDPSGSGNLWILLHAEPNSTLQQHVEAAIRTDPKILLSDWFSMHSLILSTYLPSWRWCIAELGEGIETTTNEALNIDPSDTEDRQNLLGLLKPQYLSDKLLPLSSRLEVALDIVQKLEELNRDLLSRDVTSVRGFQQVLDETRCHKTVLQGHLSSISVLEKKVKGISDLLAVSLNLNYQAMSMEINNKMLKLNNAAIHDNAAVKVVTLVTLIYLPASFVSTILGMNLFDFDGGNEGGEFTISRQFWIFVIVAGPLTLLTLASWYLITQRRVRFIRRHKISDAEKGE